MRFNLRPSLLASALLSFTLPLQAGTFTNNFNNGLPPGSALYGNASIPATGGVDNTGYLELTKNTGNQQSSWILDDLDAGAPIYGFDMYFKVRVDPGNGNNNPADGWNINFAPDLPLAGWGEGGAGSGLTIVFDTYINSPADTSRTIQAKLAGTVIKSVPLTLNQIITRADYVDVHLQVTPAGILNLTYKGMTIFTNLALPTFYGLQGQFAFGGRTGGASAEQGIDDLGITTYLTPEVGISQQPLAQTVLAGSDAVFKVGFTSGDGSFPNTIQWYKNGTALDGEVNDTLTIPAVSLADNGTKYKVVLTGANNTVTSEEVTLNVADIPLPATPELSFDFESGVVPAGTVITNAPAGAGYFGSGDGVDSSTSLHLTDAAPNEAGLFIIDDPEAGAAVSGFTAHFNMMVGGGTIPPADGFSFSFGNNIKEDPAQPFMEDGVGDGLSIGFDIYDNANEVPPAPSIDVRMNHQVIASKQVPYTFFETDFLYTDVIIRMENDGTLDVVYKGVVIFDNLPVPGFGSISGGRFAIAARTGGSSENVWIDNVEITTEQTAGPLRITSQPVTLMVDSGASATFSVGVNDSTGVTFQWLKNGAAISGATSSSYTVPAAALADDNAKYSVTVTKGGTSLTSAEATLNVVDLTAPTVTFDFNNGVPAGTILATNVAPTDPAVPTAGYISSTGGVDNSGVLHLTDAVNGQSGAFVIQPLLGGAEVSALAASFDLQISSGGTPADGFSFNFAPDLLNNTTGTAQEGIGTGLSIDFDTWDNVNEIPPAPSIDVKYKGAVVASVHKTFAQLMTGNSYRHVIIRVSDTGKLDLVYGDEILFSGLQLPNYSFIANGKFGLYAQTGGANANHWVDNLKIQLTKSTAPLSVTQQPEDVLLFPGQTATFTVFVSDPSTATYQWSKNGTPIAGATASSYTTPAVTAADTGAKF
jgi:hypothetical protein